VLPAAAAPPAADGSPTFTSFGLSPDVLADVAALGFVKPTPIQAAAIPVALTGRDVIGLAQTGTGKTAAFVLPIVERLPAHGGLRALVLSPTRELTLQTFECVKAMGKTKGFKAAAIIGGEDFAGQNAALAENPAMVVGTPGRVFDQMERRRIDPRNVQVLVLDEADRLLDMGFAEQIEAIIRCLPRERQTLLFSATMPSGIKAIARMYMHDPVEVSVGATMSAVAGCKQELYTCSPREKTMLMKWLLRQEDGQVLVFTRTKRGADELHRELRRGSHTVAVLHADRSQEERRQAMQRFRDRQVQVLVATDLASRGLDVDGIARVVNYDVPPTAEDYLHRIGRTARAHREGVASTFATVEDLSALRSIESVIKQRIPSVYVKRDELLAFAREESAREHELAKTRPQQFEEAGSDHGRRHGGGHGSRGRGYGHGGGHGGHGGGRGHGSARGRGRVRSGR
jgi:ATP-dependent RNA helicase RhlE